jgi:hypothetical protein
MHDPAYAVVCDRFAGVEEESEHFMDPEPNSGFVFRSSGRCASGGPGGYPLLLAFIAAAGTIGLGDAQFPVWRDWHECRTAAPPPCWQPVTLRPTLLGVLADHPSDEVAKPGPEVAT